MSNSTFTVTQVTYNFTATISNIANVTLNDTTNVVNVSNQSQSINLINTMPAVTVGTQGVGAGSFYNQSLNTTDNVIFNSVTTPSIFGLNGEPVYFPNGLSTNNVGTTFSTILDLGGISTTLTNQLSLFTALLPLDFGTISNPLSYSLIF
jgi:hypothetical protein